MQSNKLSCTPMKLEWVAYWLCAGFGARKLAAWSQSSQPEVT